MKKREWTARNNKGNSLFALVPFAYVANDMINSLLGQIRVVTRHCAASLERNEREGEREREREDSRWVVRV